MLVRPPFRMASGVAAAAKAVLFDGVTGYFSRTPASTTNQKTFTLSAWIKVIDTAGPAFHCTQGVDYGNSTGLEMRENSRNRVSFRHRDASANTYKTKADFSHRDMAAYAHIVWKVDTTQATAADRVVTYRNDDEIVLIGGDTFPALNEDLDINTAQAMIIGARRDIANLSTCYLADVHFIDGQALTPSSFGEADVDTGNWIPKTYAGTYGTNGFKLDFADNADLGKDVSGNGNNFVMNGTITQTADTPTNNHTVFNPLDRDLTSILSNGNRTLSATADNEDIRGTLSASTGKYSFELVPTTDPGTGTFIGIADVTASVSGMVANGVSYVSNGNRRIDASEVAYGATWTTNDVIRCEFDLDAGEVEFFKNNTSQGIISFTPADRVFALYYRTGNTTVVSTLQMTEDEWTDTPTAGFGSFSTANLPVIADKLGNHFNAVLYTGNGTAIGSGGNAITGVGFQPDFVWIKRRSLGTKDHGCYDAIRGVNEQLKPNGTGGANTVAQGLNSFDADGFTLGSDSNENNNSDTYVAWCFKLDTVKTTGWAGSPTITPSKEIYNATLGMGIVAYTGNATSGATVPHSGGKAPFMMAVKRYNTGGNSWRIYHNSAGATKAAKWDANTDWNTNSGMWNDTEPTSQLFSLGNANDTNNSGSTYIAILFYETDFCKSLEYTGDNNTDGIFLNLSGTPVFTEIKKTATSDWVMSDSIRNPYNDIDTYLKNNNTDEEQSLLELDFVSNGLKIRSVDTKLNAADQYFGFAFVHPLSSIPIAAR